MLDGDVGGFDVLEIGEVEVETVVDVVGMGTVALVGCEGLGAEGSVSCDYGSHFEREVCCVFLVRALEEWMMGDEERRVEEEGSNIYIGECATIPPPGLEHVFESNVLNNALNNVLKYHHEVRHCIKSVKHRPELQPNADSMSEVSRNNNNVLRPTIDLTQSKWCFCLCLTVRV